MDKAKIIKSIVKKTVDATPKFGTDPRDPWSVKSNITESAMLDRYLKSRGINPEFATKDQKVAHSKTTQFKIWAKQRQFEEVVEEGRTTTHTPTAKKQHDLRKAIHVSKEIRTSVGTHPNGLHQESVDKRDTVVLNIPLLIRVLELAREDIKTDMDLHRVVEKLIKIRNKGVLTMNDYQTIANIPHVKPIRHFKENHVAIAMGNMMDDEGSMVLDQLEQLERAIDMIRSHIGKDYEKQLPAWVQAKITLATDYVDTVGNYLTSKNENIKEDKFQDAMAATQTVGMEVENGDWPKQRAKSARIIKSIYKKKGIKEELYDHEKEDKSVATYGKKPKMQKSEDKSTDGSGTQAAAVLSGGNTLTGEKRDTIEIDPMMKLKPGQVDQLKK